jgi:uracil-DNA glycosylase family 4
MSNTDPRSRCDEACPRYSEHINSPRLRGQGSAKARILLVGEAPGQSEDSRGQPFIGESGKLLRGILETIGIDSKNVYITNSVKCATASENQAPNPKTINCCRRYLEKEINKIQPNVIAALGAVALRAILKRNGITKLKNNVFFSEEFNTKVVPIYHPAYILRNPGALNDFQKGLELLRDEAESSSVLQKSKIIADHYDVDTSKKINEVLDQLEKTKAFVFDLETSSLQFTVAKILCVALSWRPGLGITIKWDKFNREQLERFERILCSDRLKINQNLKFDLEMLMGQNIKVAGPYFDTLIAASVLDENVREKGLDALTLQHLDIGEYWAKLDAERDRICREKKIKRKVFSYDLFAYDLLAEYAQWDADATFRLYELFEPKLKAEELEDYYKKYSMPTMQLLVDMEFHGVLVNRKKLRELIDQYRQQLVDQSKNIGLHKSVQKFEKERRIAAKRKIALRWHNSDTLRSRFPEVRDYVKEYLREKDWKFNQKSVPQLSTLLFERLNLTPLKFSKRTKKPSTDEESLRVYADHGVKLCQDIIDHRGLTKYISTYLVSTYDKSRYDRRIHANYLQAHTVTGRLCVDRDTLVQTRSGPVPIRLLKHPQCQGVARNETWEFSPQPGDGFEVLTHTGLFRPILHVWFKGHEEMYKVLTETGTTITCTRGHSFLTASGWKRLDELIFESIDIKVVGNAARPVRIAGIIPVGRREVWDIEVAEDHSYVAQGLINHNSCVAPNMQNIPRNAKDFKECLIADPGFIFVKADLKQAEFRCWAHYANDPDMIRDIESGMDIHKRTASEVFQISEDKVTDDQRTAAKACTFGLMYGRGTRAVAKQYNLSLEQADNIRKHFFAKYPVAAQWLKDQIAFVRENGYVKTWLGRYRRLPEIYSDDDMIRAKAERDATNAPIQGLASNMNDHFMVRSYKLAARNDIVCHPAVTQHDAQIFLVKENHVKKMVKVMKYVVDTAFPDFRCKMVLDFEVGKTLGTLEKYDG